MKKKLLIASIYSEVSKQNGWYDIQKKFLDLTTKDYDFGIFYNQTSPDLPALTIGHHTGDDVRRHFHNGEYQPDDEVLAENYAGYLYDMRVAYFKIMDYFRSHQNEYDNFLLIDCDAFPVHPHWQDVLTKRMEMTARWYSGLLRGETFEDYPWLGVFYIRGEYIQEEIMDWFPRKHRNLWGHYFREFGTSRIKVYHEDRNIWYPLLRSNVVNMHPVRFGIYNHLFYHHMKGSRNKDDPDFKPNLTSLSKPEMIGYYDHYIPKELQPIIADHCHQRLLDEPEKFIAGLMRVDADEWFNQKAIKVEEYDPII
jgi:hypothetical protein